MLFRTVCLFAILCSYVNTEKLVTLNRNSEIQVKYIFQNDRRHKDFFSVIKSGKTRTRKRAVKKTDSVIVNDDFDIPSDILNHENTSEIGVTDEYEGSGFDEFNLDYITTENDATLQTEYFMRSNTTINLPQSTTKAMESSMTEGERTKVFTSSDEESSGDGGITEHSTTTAEITVTSVKTMQEKIPDICLNSTCSKDDLSVSVSGDTNLIAEGNNFTFSCKSNDSSNMLYWYKINGSVHLPQAFGIEKELSLNIADTKSIHSGTYMCVKWVNKDKCCNLQSDLIVYEIPLYEYHLIIIGLIAVLCLIVCIFLSVRKGMSLKTYTKQFVEKHGSSKQQFI